LWREIKSFSASFLGLLANPLQFQERQII